jgi:hypothetical protein
MSTRKEDDNAVGQDRALIDASTFAAALRALYNHQDIDEEAVCAHQEAWATLMAEAEAKEGSASEPFLMGDFAESLRAAVREEDHVGALEASAEAWHQVLAAAKEAAAETRVAEESMSDDESSLAPEESQAMQAALRAAWKPVSSATAMSAHEVSLAELAQKPDGASKTKTAKVIPFRRAAPAVALVAALAAAALVFIRIGTHPSADPVADNAARVELEPIRSRSGHDALTASPIAASDRADRVANARGRDHRENRFRARGVH